MLPIPFSDFIPKLLKRNLSADDGGTALANLIDTHLEEWKEELLEMLFFKLAERSPALFLSELGYYLSADLKALNTERTKRIKIDTAVARHKVRATWTYDAKIRIDAVTGYSAAIYAAEDSEDCVEMGGLDIEDSSVYWSTERGDDTMDSDLGTWELGFQTEYVVAGNIYIDCHEGVIGSTLSAAEIAEIVAEIETDVVPAYFRVYLCYIDALGVINVYPGGIIE